jgi:hypothetical protein
MNNNFWDWLMLSNQWQTNRRLEENRECLEESNRILEQIRRH